MKVKLKIMKDICEIMKDTLKSVKDILTRDLISGGTAKSRNRRREKSSELLVDIGKFIITGMAFALVLKAGDGIFEIDRGFVGVVFGGLLGGCALCFIGIRELRLLEPEEPSNSIP